MAETEETRHLMLKCWSCPELFVTANDRSTHHLEAHERPLPQPRRAPWQAVTALTGFTPPNWKAQTAKGWQTNGVHL